MENYDELVSFLTPRDDNEAIKTYQNTTAIACPACEEPFDDLVVCKQDFTSLNLTELLDVCITTTDSGSPLLFTHKQ